MLSKASLPSNIRTNVNGIAAVSDANVVSHGP